MEIQQQQQRILGLASKLKRRRSRLQELGTCFKKARAEECGSSGITSAAGELREADDSGSSSCTEASAAAQFEFESCDEAIKCSNDVRGFQLHEENRDFADVADLFLRGMGVLVGDTRIQGIFRTPDGDGSRAEEFQLQQVKMVSARGDANVHWAWYGAGKEEMKSILEHGFRMAVPSSVGYCFAPIECSRISAVQAQVDNVGEQELLLCQVVLGRVGLLSPQHLACDEQDIDTGVYDLSNPKCFVIPAGCFQGSRVLPQYVIRFKLSNEWREVIEASTIAGKVSRPAEAVVPPLQLKQKRVLAAPSATENRASNQHFIRCQIMSFPTLFSMLRSRVPPSHLALLHQHYLHFKSGIMARNEFILEIRRIVGDCLLYKCISCIKLRSQSCEQ